jgi:predicted RNA-binding Zn ribbon-like protein
VTTEPRPPAPGRLAVLEDLLNTLETDEQRDELAALETARPVVAATWPGVGELDEAGRARLVAAREAIREYLRAPQPATAVDGLAEVAAPARLRLAIGPDGVTTLSGGDGGVDAVVGDLLAILHDAGVAGQLERFKICGACGWAFYDASRNRSSRWCDMATCGSREKMRAYRSRQRESAAD